MHRYKRTLVTCAVLVFLVLISAMPSLAAKKDKPVKVFVTCKGGSNPPTTRVKPEMVEVDQDQNVKWKLHINNSNQNELAIMPKTAGQWPFEATKHVGKNGKVKTLRMKPDAEGTYEYKILYQCDETPYIIDPRVRVGGGE
jgi:hypothetical protein